MSIQTIITITCDYKDCKNGKSGPAVISWNKEAVESGQIPMPEEAKFMVAFNQGGVGKYFCCQLCASNYFLPPGYDIMRKKVETLPVAVVDGPVAQPDGAGPEESPENGQCKCGHPLDIHNRWGCCEVMSNRPGDFCKCDNTGIGPEEQA